MKLVNLFESPGENAKKVAMTLTTVAPGRWQTFTEEGTKRPGFKAESKTGTRAIEVYEDSNGDVLIYLTGSTPAGPDSFKSVIWRQMVKNGWAEHQKNWEEKWQPHKWKYNKKEEQVFVDFYRIDADKIT